MALGAVAADGLALALFDFQPADQHGVDEKGDGQRRHHSRAGAEGQVAEQPEEGELVGVGEEGEIIKHQLSLAFNASTITDILAPLEPFTSTVSPGFSALSSSGARAVEFSA